MSKSREILENTGQRVTKPRLKILEILMEKVTPMSVHDISKKMSDKKINTSTIYRNLTELEKCGVVSRVNIDKDMSYFEFVKKKTITITTWFAKNAKK